MCQQHEYSAALCKCLRNEHNVTVQGFAKDFNMMLVGMLLSALGSSVFQILPIPILSDMLPPEQIRCASKGVKVEGSPIAVPVPVQDGSVTSLGRAA